MLFLLYKYEITNKKMQLLSEIKKSFLDTRNTYFFTDSLKKIWFSGTKFSSCYVVNCYGFRVHKDAEKKKRNNFQKFFHIYHNHYQVGS